MKRICKTCKVEKDISEFYLKQTGSIYHHSECKPCSSKRVYDKMVDTRIRMIEYKGGECEHCKIKLIDTHHSIFEFHHLDPSKKDKNYKTIRGWSWGRIEKELEGCILLCANCHRLEHVKLRMFLNSPEECLSYKEEAVGSIPTGTTKRTGSLIE